MTPDEIREELKTLIAKNIVSRKKRPNILESLANSIAESMQALSNLDIKYAQDVLSQLNDQFTDELIQEIIKSEEDFIKIAIQAVDINAMLGD